MFCQLNLNISEPHRQIIFHPVTVSQSSAPTAHLVKHEVEIYNLIGTCVLLFGHCRDFSLQMHKNTQKEYIFDHMYGMVVDSVCAVSSWLTKRKKKGGEGRVKGRTKNRDQKVKGGRRWMD